MSGTKFASLLPLLLPLGACNPKVDVDDTTHTVTGDTNVNLRYEFVDQIYKLCVDSVGEVPDATKLVAQCTLDNIKVLDIGDIGEVVDNSDAICATLTPEQQLALGEFCN